MLHNNCRRKNHQITEQLGRSLLLFDAAGAPRWTRTQRRRSESTSVHRVRRAHPEQGLGPLAATAYSNTRGAVVPGAVTEG
jgi:hypothetical protein